MFVGVGQGLLSGVNSSIQQTSSHPQILANPQLVTPGGNPTSLIANPLKRKHEDDYDQP